VSRFDKAFDAGRTAIKNRRPTLLLCVLAFMSVVTSVQEYFEHHYALAVLAPLFFLLAMPWLGWRWIMPQDMKLPNHLRFVIPVLLVVGIIYCVTAHYAGGVMRLKETAGVWLVASTVAVLIRLWLRGFSQVKR
jgi:hypothetical protein